MISRKICFTGSQAVFFLYRFIISRKPATFPLNLLLSVSFSSFSYSVLLTFSASAICCSASYNFLPGKAAWIRAISLSVKPPSMECITPNMGISCNGLSNIRRKCSIVLISSDVKYPVEEAVCAGIPYDFSTDCSVSSHPAPARNSMAMSPYRTGRSCPLSASVTICSSMSLHILPAISAASCSALDASLPFSRLSKSSSASAFS